MESLPRVRSLRVYYNAAMVHHAAGRFDAALGLLFGASRRGLYRVLDAGDVG